MKIFKRTTIVFLTLVLFIFGSFYSIKAISCSELLNNHGEDCPNDYSCNGKAYVSGCGFKCKYSDGTFAVCNCNSGWLSY